MRQSTSITGCVRLSVCWSGNAFVRRSTRRTLLAYLALFFFSSIPPSSPLGSNSRLEAGIFACRKGFESGRGEGGRWTAEEDGEGEDLPFMSKHLLNHKIHASLKLVLKWNGKNYCSIWRATVEMKYTFFFIRTSFFYWRLLVLIFKVKLSSQCS